MTCQGLPLAKPDRILFTVRGSQFTVRHTRPVERPPDFWRRRTANDNGKPRAVNCEL
jgi:hypothetical protein